MEVVGNWMIMVRGTHRKAYNLAMLRKWELNCQGKQWTLEFRFAPKGGATRRCAGEREAFDWLESNIPHLAGLTNRHSVTTSVSERATRSGT